MSTSIFNDLFVLELANNHWGKADRGLRIVDEFGAVVRRNHVKAAIKLQFRDVDILHPQGSSVPRRSPLHQEGGRDPHAVVEPCAASSRRCATRA